MATNYLTEKLSDETLVHILSYANHEDFIRLAQTCQRFNNLLRDKDFCQSVRLNWQAQIARQHLTRFLQDKPRACIITKLDLSDVYWIPSGIIRDLVVHMQNLQAFLVAGTCLSWIHLSKILKTLPITCLSWSWDNSLEESCRRRSSISPTKFAEVLELQDSFLKLKSLLIHIPMMTKTPTDVIFYSYSALEFLVSLCHNLEELWFLSWPKTAAERKSSSSSYSSRRRDFQSLSLSLQKLHTVVISVKGPPRFSPMNFFCRLVETFGVVTPATTFWLDHPLLGIRSLYSNGLPARRFGQVVYGMWTPQLCAEEATKLSYPLMGLTDETHFKFKYPKLKHVLISHGQLVVTGLNGVLDHSPDLESFTCSTFNLRIDWKKFVLNHLKLQSICVSEGQGLGEYCVAFSKLSRLEKLSVSIECLYEITDANLVSEYASNVLASDSEVTTYNNHQCEEPQQSTSSIIFKKQRKGVPAQPSKNEVSGLSLISFGCPKINELEIGYGELDASRWGRLLPDSLFSISRFKHLRKLSLSSIPIIHGKFLVEICSSCNIESLRLTHLGPTAKCSYLIDLCQAISLCTHLKDFRLEQNYIGNPLPLLTALKNCSNLVRLLIWSSPNDKPLDLEPTLALFQECRKLFVFYAAIETTTKSECRRIRKVLEEKYKKERSGLSIVLRRTLEEEELINYPSIHYRQMVVNLPHVCQINDFKAFNS